jgi:hypothetical protein
MGHPYESFLFVEENLKFLFITYDSEEYTLSKIILHCFLYIGSSPLGLFVHNLNTVSEYTTRIVTLCDNVIAKLTVFFFERLKIRSHSVGNQHHNKGGPTLLQSPSENWNYGIY